MRRAAFRALFGIGLLLPLGGCDSCKQKAPGPAPAPTAIGSGSSPEKPMEVMPHKNAVGDEYWVFKVVTTYGYNPVPDDLGKDSLVCILCPKPKEGTTWDTSPTVSPAPGYKIQLTASSNLLGCQGCPDGVKRAYEVK